MTVTHWYNKVKYPEQKVDEAGHREFLELCGAGYLGEVRKYMVAKNPEGGFDFAINIINNENLCRDMLCWEEIKKYLLKKGDTVLNIGSNSGLFTCKMTRQGYPGTGIEASKLLVDFSNNELKSVLDQELYGNVKFYHGIERDALGIFGEKSFDTIFTKHVFEHLEDPVGALQRWKKLARKGICGIVPAEPKIEKKGNAQHLFRYSEKVLKRLIEEQGYKNVGTCSFTANANVVVDPTITCTSIGYWGEI